ncbi:MAG: hypothetical protein JXA22_09080 [Candidatus Thermoplasmatota archaeon]|nr:hypothetical protein [Candidatus Thermoplasmatota archaeon]
MKVFKGLNDRGDAIMVTSVLMISILLSVGSNYLIQYGDRIGREDDMEHVTDVEDSMLRIRTSMNSLITTRDTNTMILNRVTMGTPGNPYLTVARSSGILTHSPDPTTFHMDLIVRGTTDYILNSINGAITFESNNYYFHDQKYHFTAGGVVREQLGTDVMSSYPDITVSESGSRYNMQLFLYGMAGEQWKISGIETVPLKIRMAGYSDIERNIGPTEQLVIKVNGIGEVAWYNYLKGYLTEKGLVEGSDFDFVTPADWGDPGQYLTIELPGIESLFARIGDMEVDK